MVGKWEEMYRWDDGVNVSFLRYFCLLSHFSFPLPGDLREVQRLTGCSTPQQALPSVLPALMKREAGLPCSPGLSTAVVSVLSSFPWGLSGRT